MQPQQHSAAPATPRPSHWSTANLSPGYFALVMGTSIVSIALHLCDFRTASTALLVIAALSYGVLVAANVWRFIAHRDAVRADFTNIRQSFGFFTFVAGTAVLGSRLALSGWWTTATVLLIIAGVTWLILGYVVPVVAVLGRSERPIVQGANGLWFLWVVGAQSVAVLAATLEPHLPAAHQVLAVTAVFAWSIGIVLYAAVGLFVALRMMTFPLDPREFNPPYWISMGAVAITVVAAARIAEMTSSPMVDATRGLVAGIAVLMWCFATWMTPGLIAIGVWRHGIHRIPLTYEPTLWSIVFPLGMYSVAGIYLGRVNALPIVEWIGSAWLWVAVTAWCAVALGMLTTFGRSILRRR